MACIELYKKSLVHIYVHLYDSILNTLNTCTCTYTAIYIYIYIYSYTYTSPNSRR